MSALFERLQRLFDEGHGVSLPDLHSDAHLAPLEIRPAAVLIAVTERAEPGVLFIQRPAAMRQHAGQVAFPGGKLDPGEDALTAALREAEEELGLAPAAVRVIGASDRFVTGTGYDVTPVLAVVPPDLPLVPNPVEVDAWFEAPLAFVFDPANHRRRLREWRGATRETIEIEWEGHLIWGVTAAIIANLARRVAWHGRVDG
jgi:8-oxo-dGTP pyrophosphatase MutT (NUDIX family)